MVGASPSGSIVVGYINNLDASNPLHVQNSDNSNFVIIPFKLLGTEFGLVPGCYWLTGCKVLGGELGLHQELMKLMQFLMGLDDCYHPVRSSLLTRELLPKVKDAYIVVSREESHRGVYDSSGVTESKLNATSFAAKLGHPADQVRFVLKNDLSVSKDTFVPGCEVCHKAKQTRKPFPLSKHKSKTLGELVHLDLWGPYGVPS
ncbi:hypothetical protein Tco_0956521 [Tanacetum coccineum]